jgi:hypothetical protein
METESGNNEELTLFLKDVENDTFLFQAKHKKYHSLIDAATNDLDRFFDKNFSVYTSASPKAFILHFKILKVRCGYFDVSLKVGERKVRKEYIGAPQWNTEETFQYDYSMGISKEIDENEFVLIELALRLGGLKAPGVNRLAELIRRDFVEKKKTEPER